ncbi:uncharacterized protein LOC134686222 [Mytilus trossulus]|uniref:uncharacterized protein LOC134686222 n=1 Tax=Mytilus trossulus TaxID=6551 RepID=UPI003007A15E
MNFVKRRGSTACKSNKVENFDELKKEYLERIEKTVVDFDIPSNLVINWDHAGLNVVPVTNWTMAVEGSKRVEISGLGNKRQITGVFAGSLSGEFLPPQIIYGGKTDKCHPTYKFPSDWDITHSENHWANTDTQMEDVKNIILPYIRKIKRSAKLNKDQKALCIFDVFRAQMGEDFLAFLDEKNIKVVFLPPCCTDRLQPLDVSVQKAVKNKMRNFFEQWYSNEIVTQLDGKEIVDSENEPIVPVDLSLTRLKPFSGKWLVQMFQHIQKQSGYCP